MNTNGLKNIGLNLIEATAYGDAAGLPVETLSSDEIREEFGYIDRLIPTNGNIYFAGEYAPGQWSDDTELTIAVAEALSQVKGFDLDSLAQSHIDAYRSAVKVTKNGAQVPRGWGGSTVNSVKRLMSGYDPKESGESGGSGNGVLMKMTPMVFSHLAKNTPREQRYYEYDMLTSLTHDSDIARWATRVHGDVLTELATRRNFNVPQEVIVDTAVKAATFHEKALNIGREYANIFNYLSKNILTVNAQTILDNTDKKGFFCPQTLAMAYGAFIIGGNNFESTVYSAVNLGGDTDSIASIAANMVNFYSNGVFTFPEDIGLLHRHKDLKDISSAFAEIVLADFDD